MNTADKRRRCRHGSVVIFGGKEALEGGKQKAQEALEAVD